MIIKRNWCDAHPTMAHQSGVDWRLLSSAIKTRGDIEEPELEPQYRCLRVYNMCLLWQTAVSPYNRTLLEIHTTIAMSNARRGLPLTSSRIEKIFPKLTPEQIDRIAAHGRTRSGTA